MTRDNWRHRRQPDGSRRHARPRRRRSARRRRATPYLFVAPAVVYLLGITLYPGIYAIYQSFFLVRFNAWTFAGLANYQKLLTDPEFWHGARATPHHRRASRCRSNASSRWRSPPSPTATPGSAAGASSS